MISCNLQQKNEKKTINHALDIPCATPKEETRQKPNFFKLGIGMPKFQE